MTDQQPTPSGTDGLSKNLVFAAVSIMIVLGLAGVVLLHLFRPDASATLVQTIVQFAGILTTLVTVLYGLGKVGDRIEVVRKQTNGTLSALREEIERKEAVIQQLHGEKTELALKVSPDA
ncbi:hypothetical protein ABC195_09475 [Microbacterium sp. 2P01SA-2]|uniref:hypothetical protein n=1 Tax=unclassified Microbacterium TaxID=2609290 RepID=UPI00399FB06C